MKLAMVGVLVGCRCAVALNPSLEVNQYGHAAWTFRSGFFREDANFHSVAQTPDGYLWLGTRSGLLRFDGVRAVPWQPPAGQRLPDGFVFRLYTSRDGRLWIGTSNGLASWKDGKLTEYPELSKTLIRAILEDSHGTMWVSGGNSAIPGGARLCTIQNEKADCAGSDQFSNDVTSLYEDRAGNLWVAETKGLWRWRPGPPTRVYTSKGMQVFYLTEGDRGEILMSDRNGGPLILRNGRVGSYTPPGLTGRIISICSLRDRNGAWWIGTIHGLIHVYNGRTDTFDQSDGLSSNNVLGIFEDREGNIWVLSTGGLDQFHDLAAPALWFKQGLSGTLVTSVLATHDGSVWLATQGGGLDRWQNGRMTVYRRRAPEAQNGGRLPSSPYVRHVYSDKLPSDGTESLFEDSKGRIWVATHQGVSYFKQGRFFPVQTHSDTRSQYTYAILEDSAHNIWTVQDDGLFRLRGNELTDRVDWSRLGHEDAPYCAIVDHRRGGMWLGFETGGVVHFMDNAVRESYAIGDGTIAYEISGFQLDDDGTLWFGSKAGLSCVKNGHLSTLSRRNGLRCDQVNSIIEDEDQAIWIYTNCGLVRIARWELEAWIRDPNRVVQTTLLDSTDGARNTESTFQPQATRSQDGKLWFATLADGVNIVDPRNLFVNKLPPPVHVEQITADGKTYDAEHGLRLPPRIRDLSIRYTALSFVAPEKIHFRYKLEGQDANWRVVVNDREVQYSNLGPGSYRFWLTASNNSGVWNESGDSFEFFIKPAYYQTTWFRALCAAAFCALLWGLYQYRVHQIARETDARMEERMTERMRIARELHDTLLQSFQGLLIRLQAGYNLMAARPEEARKAFEIALDQGSDAMAEARAIVQQLRDTTVVTDNLAREIGSFYEHLQMSSANGTSASVTVEVQEAARELHPMLRDEVFRIASEALRNAFKHAEARRISVMITYGDREFQLHVRDDGQGIDPEILDRGAREGHWGLSGMRERAEAIGGRLDVWSAPGAGTQIELGIPAARAYAKSPERRWRFFEKGRV
jgi:signal transduction histidine kinase/ligand-binding sensor domain-containing protein